MKKRIMSIALAIVLVLTLAILPSCRRNPEDYTEQEHIQRISQRIQKKYMTKDSEYTGFSVYPLYAADETLEFFIVEFEPMGIVIVRTQDEGSVFESCLGLHSMYTRALTPNLGSGWMKYYLDEKGKVDFYEERDKETGDPPRYVMSPYEKYIDERRYMLCVADGAYVPALKRGDKFLNAITDVEFDVQDEHDLNSQIFLHVSFVACVGDL